MNEQTEEQITEEQVEQAQQEEPTPEPEPEPEPEPTPEPEPPPEIAPEPESAALFERRFKDSERAWRTYTGKISNIFAEDGQHLHECPLCPAMHKGFIDARDAGLVPDEIRDVTMEFLGLARPAELEDDPDTDQCPTCKGYGEVTTGSRVVGNERRKCRRCKGFGYTPPPETATNGAVHREDFHLPAGEHPEPLEGSDTDPSGEPRLLPDGRENPNYGKWPQFKVQVAPWGTTAGLTVQDAVA